MAQKHNAETINAPMTRAGTAGTPADNKRIIRGFAYTATKFSTENPMLQDGELGYEKDTHLLKVGDGTTKWNDLAYAGSGSSLPDQTGHSGEFLTTDGTDASWGAVTAESVGAVPQYETMPTASADNVGEIVQFSGTTDANYTNGYFYKCVSDGQEPATYSWTQVNVQPSSGGGLPSQIGNAGKFLTTDGTDASWSDKPLTNNATGNGSVGLGGGSASAARCFVYGISALSIANDGIAVGYDAQISGSTSYSAIALGRDAKVSAVRAIQFGSGTNSDANTFKVANANGNFEIMSADGTIPAARHAALPVADGTYVLKLVIASGVPTLSWVAE